MRRGSRCKIIRALETHQVSNMVTLCADSSSYYVTKALVISVISIIWYIGLYSVCVLSKHRYYPSKENPDVLEDRKLSTDDFVWVGSSWGVKFRCFSFLPYYSLVVVFAQTDKTLISWAFCNHWTTPTGRPQSGSTPSEVKGHGQMKTSYYNKHPNGEGQTLPPWRHNFEQLLHFCYIYTHTCTHTHSCEKKFLKWCHVW